MANNFKVFKSGRIKITGISGIYKISCLINNKIYIGSASCLSSRKRDHFNFLKRNKHYNSYLQRSFNKHGESNFVFEVLEYCEKENLLKREQHYLDTLKKLFNICKTAGSTLGRKRPLIERLEMSRRQKGKEAPNLCETYQISLIGEIINLFPSTKEAMKKTGVYHFSIGAVCRLEQHSSGGYLWCYKKNIDNNLITIEELVYNYNRTLKHLSKKIKNNV